ncbi:MAG: molybdopterin converting factor subunit 1 [bacterium]
MKIKLKYFAQLRDLLHSEENELELSSSITVLELMPVLADRFPQIREHLKVISIAVNNEYATKDTLLQEGDEVALIPPISGG